MSFEDVRLARQADTLRNIKVNLVNDWRTHSEQTNWHIRREIPRIYDLYRGVRPGRFHVHKNNVHIPLLYSIIWAHAARKVQTSFGLPRPLRFAGASDDPDDAKIGRKWDNLIAAQMSDAKTYQKAIEFVTSADLYGRATLQHGWRFRDRLTLVPDTAALPISETQVPTFRKERVVDFNGPWWEVKDFLDCFPQPGFKDIDDMKWYIVRYWLDFDQVLDLAEQGIFDINEVMRMRREGGGSQSTIDTFKAMRGLSHFQSDDATARERERFGRPVEIIEAWANLPRELAPDGLRHRVLSVGNGQFLLRDKSNPYLHGHKPFISYAPNPDMHHHYAPGKGEISKPLQIAVNKFVNHGLDALDVSIDPITWIDRAANLTAGGVLLRPGRIIPIDGPPQQRVFQQPANLQGMEAALATSQFLWKQMQQATGIVEDVALGQGGGGRTTAREFLGRQEAVATRLLLEARLGEIQWIEPLGNFMVALDKQFLPTPFEFLILGESATNDGVTGQPIPQGRDQLNPSDLTRSYTAQAIGATTRLAKSARIQDILLFSQVIGSNEQLNAQFDHNSWARLIAREIGLGPEVSEVIRRADDPRAALVGAVGSQGNPDVANAAGAGQGQSPLAALGF